MTLIVEELPAGADLQTASSFITFVDPATEQPKNVLTFTGPNQPQTVRVKTDIPLGSNEGNFKYLIKTSGWPADITDAGTRINAQAALPSGIEEPEVEILSPLNGTVFTHVLGGPAVPVAISVAGTATPSAPVTSLTATLSAQDENGALFLEGMPLDLSITGLGTPDTGGDITIPVTQPGIYTLTATATNRIGSATTSSTFIVEQQVPPPTVVINPPTNNPTYTYVRGVTSATVPYEFQGSTLKGSILTLTATLDGVPLTPAALQGIGELTATGSGSLTYNVSTPGAVGQHTISVTATTQYGSATTSATFVVAEIVPQISVNITQPNDGLVLSLPPDASPLNVAFSFTGAATDGANVTALSATLASNNVTTPLSLSTTSGLNTPNAVGSGSILGLQPGVYTLTAIATNAALGLTATDSITFTVTPPPPPAIVFTQAPQPSYSVLRGNSLAIPFAIQTSSTGAYIATQSVTLDGQPVSFSSTANGTALIATGSGTLSVPASANGVSTHTLIATGTDAFGNSVSTQTTFQIVVTDPVITIAINPEIAANSPYTLPSSGGLAIPFTFTDTITAGATVDTITGSLNGTPVAISSSTGLGTSALATVSGTLFITEPGTYALTATDTNTSANVSATTTVVFVVEASSEPAVVNGTLFFDVNFNGVREAGEYGMGGVTVRLLSPNGNVVATTVSDEEGNYTFAPAGGTYIVSAGSALGFSFTTAADHNVTLAGPTTAPDIGYGLHFASIQGLAADGLSHGYWKNNIDKALSGKKNGVQVSAETLAAYTAVIGDLALEPFDGITMKAAVDAMSATGSNPTTLLAKQLVASEYNYASGAFIGGSEPLTHAFIYFAEYVLKHANQYSSSYILFVKDWCDAYNNTHGGAIAGPKS